ncbi:hypothetical protein ABTH88_22910, partial [Acinetobacter baumannii]
MTFVHVHPPVMTHVQSNSRVRIVAIPNAERVGYKASPLSRTQSGRPGAAKDQSMITELPVADLLFPGFRLLDV